MSLNRPGLPDLWLRMLLLGLIPFSSQAQEAPWYFQSLQLSSLAPTPSTRPIVIAIVDDGFRLDHEQLRDFWLTTPSEALPNYRDDDGNGWTDDYCGWDAADDDPEVSIPAGREAFFYHGTYIAGVITDILRHCLGDSAHQYVKIVPVKALADQTQRTYLEAGYKGLAYAVAQKPDLIVCAWNGGGIGPEEDRLLREARQQGITVMASGGNFFAEKADSPASHPDVTAIAAVDSTLQKTTESNYGMFIALSAPGTGVRGADALHPQGFRQGEGTSAAVAVTAALWAILQQQFPTATSQDIQDALRNTAQPLEPRNPRYAGKLGSGLPQLQQALVALKNNQGCCQPFNPQLPEGSMLPQHLPRKAKTKTWEIAPKGDYQGIWLELTGPANRNISFAVKGSDRNQPAETLALTGTQQQFFIPGNQATVQLTATKTVKNAAFRLAYHAATIDSTRLFCRDTRYWENPSGRFDDGSGKNNYASNCDCRWQIRGPVGSRIEIRFPAFATEAKTDFVYLFDGDSPIPENMIAKFSGPNIPPVVTSRTHQVLVWFVTDGQTTAPGWTLEYTVVR